MSLEKSKTIDKVEFVGTWKTLQVRYEIIVTEDGTTISKSYHRESFELAEIDTLPEELQPYAQGVWTDELLQKQEEERQRWIAENQQPEEQEETQSE